jgi:hypothetical protein
MTFRLAMVSNLLIRFQHGEKGFLWNFDSTDLFNQPPRRTHLFRRPRLG